MSVDVQIGDAVVRDTDRSFWGWLDTAAQNVVVTTSNPSNPRNDILVAYIDKSITTTTPADNQNGFDFKIVAGTPAGSPTDPSDPTIQTAVGGTNPWIKLARIVVGAGVSSIVNANITDLRTPAALNMAYLWGGASNTKGHLVPNVADDTLALLAAAQTFTNKTLTNPVISNPTMRAWDGWQDANETWTYASASTFTVSGVDVTSKYPIGTKLKLTQSATVRYFYVVGTAFSTNTTITISPGQDASGTAQTLANSAITANSYSYQATPQGFPSDINWASGIAFTNLTLGTGGTINYVKFGLKSARKAYMRFDLTFGTSPAVSGNIGVNLPVAFNADITAFQNLGILSNIGFYDVSAGITIGGVARFNTSTQVALNYLGVSGASVAFTNTGAGAPFTVAVGDRFSGEIEWPI